MAGTTETTGNAQVGTRRPADVFIGQSGEGYAIAFVLCFVFGSFVGLLFLREAVSTTRENAARLDRVERRLSDADLGGSERGGTERSGPDGDGPDRPANEGGGTD